MPIAPWIGALTQQDPGVPPLVGSLLVERARERLRIAAALSTFRPPSSDSI